jgi:hypothetical protein
MRHAQASALWRELKAAPPAGAKVLKLINKRDNGRRIASRFEAAKRAFILERFQLSFVPRAST